MSSEPKWTAEHTRLARLIRLAGKELREILRDRRTILTLVLMPLLLYPLLSVAFQQFFLSQLNATGGVQYLVAFPDRRAAEFGVVTLTRGGLSFEERAGPIPPGTVRWGGSIEANPEQAVQQGDYEVALRPRSEAAEFHLDPSRDLSVDLELLYREDSAASREAARMVSEALAKTGQEFLASRLTRLEISQRADPLFVQKRSLTEAAAESNRFSLVAVIPLILTLMTVTGAVYPAIDLTAGERERGTLEVLVSAPIPRLSVLVAKYIAVLAVALLTASVNLAMMAVTLRLSGLGATLFGGDGLSGASLAAIAALMLLFASFYSAVLLVVTCTARSFKEAQAYLIPVILLSLSPAVLSLMPGVQLVGLLQLLPPVNLVLLGRDLLTRQVEPRSAAIVVVSTLVYAGLALALAARLFGSEAVLYNTATGWSGLLRRPRQPQSRATPPLGWMLIALAFPGFFLLQGLAGLASSLIQKLIAGGLTTVMVFVVVPLLVLTWRRIRWTAWYTAPASPWAWLGAGFLGLSLWILDHELIVAVAQWREVDFSQLLPRLEGYATALRQVPLPLLLLLISIIPAVCEEFFFRGVLWSALAGPEAGTELAPALPEAERLAADQPPGAAPLAANPAAGDFRAWWTTSIVFGLFHLVMPNPLAVERLVGTTAMGFVLGWVRRKSGSAWAGTLLHVLHNAVAVLVSYHADALQRAGLASVGAIDQHFPPSWIAGAAAVVVLGLLLVGLSGRRQTPGR